MSDLKPVAAAWAWVLAVLACFWIAGCHHLGQAGSATVAQEAIRTIPSAINPPPRPPWHSLAEECVGQHHAVGDDAMRLARICDCMKNVGVPIDSAQRQQFCSTTPPHQSPAAVAPRPPLAQACPEQAPCDAERLANELRRMTDAYNNATEPLAQARCHQVKGVGPNSCAIHGSDEDGQYELWRLPPGFFELHVAPLQELRR